ncbi:MAG: hypothetical protein M3177_04640, partial [Pseudomonadota bacterium]|nr:hypothetical protein [Pseudomonadota bacterium]
MSEETLERLRVRQPHSLQELRPAHVKLLQRWSQLDDREKIEAGILLRRIAVKSGRWIKDPDERDGAQGIIDYWTATMAGLPGYEDDGQFDLLADFDSATVRARDQASPYVGLRPFTIDDAPFFFGREAATQELLARLDEQPLIIVAGPSGRGKSSLIQAGAAAQLASRPGTVVLPAVTPGRDPLGALLRTVRPAEAPPEWLEQARAEAEKKPDQLRLLIEERLGPGERAVLVIDRAEELFTSDLSTAEIGAAVAALRALVGGESGARHLAVVGIRADHLDQLRTAATAAGLKFNERTVFEPAAPTREELLAAIVEPGQRIGFRFEPRVVEDLAGNLERERDALPLLQFTLARLWDSVEVDRVAWNDYLAVGTPCRIIHETAERTYSNLGSMQALNTA